jgi:hypothetical protein
MSREKSPRDLVWDQLAEHFGEPRTKTERNMFGRIVAELMEAGANADEVRAACLYVLAAFDNPSVFSIVKWFTAAQQGQRPGRMSPQQQALDQLRGRNE